MSVLTLQRPTLVLNRNWQPVNIISVARSMSMVYRGTARVVDPNSYQLFQWQDWSEIPVVEGEPYVQAVSQRFRIPEVIALKDFDKLPISLVTFNRRNIFKRDRYTCQYCGKQPDRQELTIDHVLPRSRNGTSTWENCVLACIGCNRRKADRLPVEAGMRLRNEPIQPRWTPAYSRHSVQMQSWRSFISNAYWDAELKS